MRLHSVLIATIALTFGGATYARAAADAAPVPAAKQAKTATNAETRAPTFAKKQNSNVVSPYQLMTQEERKAFRAKMRSFKTPQERQAYRLEHRKMLEKRAEAKGEKLRPMPTGAAMRARAAEQKAKAAAADKKHPATPAKKPTIPAEIKAGRG